MRLLLVLVPLLALVACQPLYLPPIPAPLELPERLEIDATMALDEGRPTARIGLKVVPKEGWLALQWFSPANREVASQSEWISTGDVGRIVELPLPADVELSSGRWRAVLSFRGELLRQITTEVGVPN